ncbi:hypothetical protein [Herbidospora sp. RD11066]
MADELGTPSRPSARSYDAPTTPLPIYRPPVDETPAPPPPPPETGGNRMRILWTIFAALVMVAAVVFAFSAFSADEPVREVAVLPAAESQATAPTPKPSRTALSLPRPPAQKTLATYSGTGTAMAGLIDDRRSGIVYAAFADPWEQVKPDPFQFRQRAGQAIIASSPIPGANPGTPKTAATWRDLTVKAARWTVTRYQPKESTFQWTASQKIPGGTGWMLGYRVAWETGGRRHTAEAIVVLVRTSGKPGMLFASVPDSRKELRKDLNTLLETVRPR